MDCLGGIIIPEEPDENISIGYQSATGLRKNRSVVVAWGESTYISEDSNINFAHVMEANSDTKEVIFPGEVTVPSLLVGDSLSMQKIDDCDACQEEGVGFQFDAGGTLGSICMICIRRSAMSYYAKEEWASANGDPIAKILRRLEALEKK
jgi:hypothetical protein